MRHGSNPTSSILPLNLEPFSARRCLAVHNTRLPSLLQRKVRLLLVSYSELCLAPSPHKARSCMCLSAAACPLLDRLARAARNIARIRLPLSFFETAMDLKMQLRGHK